MLALYWPSPQAPSDTVDADIRSHRFLCTNGRYDFATLITSAVAELLTAEVLDIVPFFYPGLKSEGWLSRATEILS